MRTISRIVPERVDMQLDKESGATRSTSELTHQRLEFRVYESPYDVTK